MGKKARVHRRNGVGSGASKEHAGKPERKITQARPEDQRKSVAVLVLGDIGRSPRMQYHALSLSKHGYHVDLIGYPGSTPMQEILTSHSITLRHVKSLPPPTSAPRAVFYLYAPVKVLYQLLALFWMLLVTIKSPDVILVQNPPAVPTLLVARICAFLVGARLVIDWHNYGYTILGMKLGANHLVVAAARWFERVFGRSAYMHLCVTEAMAADLRDIWGVRGKLVVLHDKAPRHFKHLDAGEMHRLWTRLLKDPQFAQLAPSASDTAKGKLLLTCKNKDGSVAMREDRPMLMMSSTSWTADEDFSILLDALALYEAQAESKLALPQLVVVITGRGPLRAYYEAEIAKLQLRSVRIVTAWLSAEDYPLLLGSSDLGISLHTSSSGLDLPMKVVDMLGCGTPVCAYQFSCIHELVTDKNGMVFNSASDLAHQIQRLTPDTLGLGIVAMFRNVLRSSFNEDSSNPALPQKKEPDQTPPSLSRQHTQDSAGTSHQIQQQKQTQPSTGAAADAGSPAATQTAAPASDHPAPEAVLVDAMSLASQHPSLMSEDSPLADRLEALAELLPELKNRRLTNISSLWHTLKGMVPFAFGGSTAQAAQEWQLETSAPPSAISADSGRQSSARNLILNVLVALAKSDQKHGDCSEDMAQTRKEILRVICSASGWDEIVLAVQCATWASCNAQSLEGDPIDWFKRAKEWSDQAIGQCYPEDAVRVDPFEDLPDDVCACLSASLDFLANIVREEYPVLDPDFVSATVASLCVKAACTRPVEENGIKEVTWIWTKPEHLYGVLRLLKTTINYGALSQEVMRPGVLLLCTTVHIPMCAELCCDIVYRMFSSCYMRDALLTMNNILRDDNSPESTMPFYGVPSMTPHQAAVNGMVYFITRVMDTGPTGIQFSLRTGSCLPVLGKAAQCMHPEALSLVFPYLCTIVNDARADSMLADDWQVLIGILETTIDCRLGGEHNDDPDSGDESEGSEGSDEYIPLAKLYDCVLRSITKVVRRMDGPTPTSLIGLIYRLRNDIDDEIALDLLRFIDARGNPPPGAATWLEMLEELMRLYYFDRSRSLSLRRSAIRLCSKSFSDAADDSPSGIEHAPFVLSIFEQLCIEEDGELVKCALEILRPLLKRTRHPDIFSKLLQFSANAASEPEYCRPNQPMSSPSPPLSPRFFSSDSPAAAGNPAIHHIAQTAPQSLQQPSPGHGGTAGQSEDDYLSHHRVISVVRCLLEAFEWRMAITDDAGDGDPMQSASMTIELVNALLDLLDSEHAFPSVQRIILSVFLRLHADSSLRLYILQQGGDTVMDQRVSIHESARLRLESTRKAAPSDDSMQTEAPKFPISKYVRILTNLLNTNQDHETYHVLCQGL
ncbi:mannosyltransferase, partial [Dipsacomyces acuminosporus]